MSTTGKKSLDSFIKYVQQLERKFRTLSRSCRAGLDAWSIWLKIESKVSCLAYETLHPISRMKDIDLGRFFRICGSI